jgi:uncharacterized protein YdhG (YjbR/CyaY superfamily)
MKKGKSPVTVDSYINAAPKQAQSLLNQMRKIIRAEAPQAEESVSYGMPGYKYLGRPLIYFAAYENHIGFYATPTGHEAFKKELSVYKTGKGSVQFPVNEKLPVALIKKIIQFRVKENEEKSGKKTVVAVTVKSKQSRTSDEEAVKSWLGKLDTATRKQVDAVRKIIRSSSPLLNERIKWNAPSYYYKEDIITFGPYKNGKLLLVFHHPDIVKIKSSLLEGNYKDRRLVYFNSTKEIAAGKKELERIIKEMVNSIK